MLPTFNQSLSIRPWLVRAQMVQQDLLVALEQEQEQRVAPEQLPGQREVVVEVAAAVAAVHPNQEQLQVATVGSYERRAAKSQWDSWTFPVVAVAVEGPFPSAELQKEAFDQLRVAGLDRASYSYLEVDPWHPLDAELVAAVEWDDLVGAAEEEHRWYQGPAAC